MEWNILKSIPGLFRKSKSSPFALAIRGTLGSGQAGTWASDHRTEAEQFDGWTYVAIRAICLQLMQAEVLVFDEAISQGVTKSLYAGEDGEADPLPNDHPLCKILKKPNPTQSGAKFRYEMGMQLQLTGSVIIWNVPNRFGKPVERYVIPTAVATPVQPGPDLPEGGYRIQASSSRYVAMDESGFVISGIFNKIAGRVVPMDQLQVIRWPHPIYKDDGQSTVSAGAKWIDSANQIDQARWAQMNNGADPSVVVNVDPAVRPTQEDLDAAALKFDAKYGGTENTGKAIFTIGGTTTSLTTTPKDMNYQEAFEQLRDSILALHGVPGIAAGLTDGGSYAAFVASMKQFTHLTIQPILDMLAEEETERLAPYFGKSLLIDMTAASITDPEQEQKQLDLDIRSGATTKDEYRAATGKPPLGPDKGGDDLIGGPAPAQPPAPGSAGPFSTGEIGRKSFLHDDAAMKKAYEITRSSWKNYPGGDDA